MEKILEWINKHKKLSVLLIVLVIFAPILIIHILFKIKTNCYFITAEWDSGDVLGYFGNVLSFIGTVFLGYVAVCQSQKANQLSNEIVKLEWGKIKPSLDIIQNQKSIIYYKKKEILEYMNTYDSNKDMILRRYYLGKEKTNAPITIALMVIIVKNTGNSDIRDIVIASGSCKLWHEMQRVYNNCVAYNFSGNTYIKKGEKKRLFIEFQIQSDSKTDDIYKYVKGKRNKFYPCFEFNLLLITPDEIAFEERICVETKYSENIKCNRIERILYTEEMIVEKK